MKKYIHCKFHPHLKAKKLINLRFILFTVTNTSIAFVTNSLISVNILLTTWQYLKSTTRNIYSGVLSPSSEANHFSASQEIPRISWNPKVHYSIHMCPPPVPILSQPNLVHNPTSWRAILMLSSPSMPGSPKWPLSLKFPHQNPVYTSPLTHTLHAPPISFFSILSPEQNWVRSTDH